MRRRKGGDRREESRVRYESVDCPSCGCPNKPGGRNCMYCGAALTSPQKGFMGHISCWAAWHLEALRASAGSLFPPGFILFVKTAAALMIALGLLSGGLFLVVSGLAGGKFASWGVGALMVFYGGAIAMNFYRGIRRG